MLTTNRKLQPEGPTLVKVDPMVKRFRLLKIMMVGSMAIFLIGALFIYLAFKLTHGMVLPMTLVSLILISTSLPVSIINTLLQGRFCKRLEQKRQAAARGEQNLLAAEQPAPHANALQLPVTIEQRPNWFVLLLIPGILFALMVIFIIIIVAFLPQLLYIPTHRPVSQIVAPIMVITTLVVTLLLCGLIFTILYSKVRQQITITEHGLLKLGIRKARTITWNEARLFAMGNILGAKNNTHTPCSMNYRAPTRLYAGVG